jgi:hypothetical protein
MTPRQRDALNQAKRLAFGVPGIRGVDFGTMYRKGRVRSVRSGIRFHVAQKLPPGELSKERLLPKAIDGSSCDVIQASYEPHAVRPTDPFDPLQPGISIGNLTRQSTGSLGAFVRDVQGGRPCMLSNWHVLAGSTAAAIGDPISQPGPRHLEANPARPVAQLLRWTDLSHGVDAALAAVEQNVATDGLPFGLTKAAVGVAEPAVGMRVVKSGVITGVTHAIVDGIEGSFPMNYSAFGDTQRWMDGIRLVVDPAARVDEISLRGDSGAIWIDVATNLAVGLHFAGEDGLGPLAEYALAHPLPRVLNMLRAEWQV